MQYSMSNARIAETWLNSSRMKSEEIALNATQPFRMTGKILVVGNGVHLHPLTQEISVQNLEGQSLGILGIIFNHFNKLAMVFRMVC